MGSLWAPYLERQLPPGDYTPPIRSRTASPMAQVIPPPRPPPSRPPSPHNVPPPFHHARPPPIPQGNPYVRP
eukprot:14007298-Heterocapsa_arctica.AAC.1